MRDVSWGGGGRRVRGEEYRELMEETLEAISRRFGSSVFIAAQDMSFQSCSSFLQQCVSPTSPRHPAAQNPAPAPTLLRNSR